MSSGSSPSETCMTVSPRWISPSDAGKSRISSAARATFSTVGVIAQPFEKQKIAVLERRQRRFVITFRRFALITLEEDMTEFKSAAPVSV